jgi:uncharacterized SAM-binding protein YcdF (DUF218 family)
MLVGDFAQSGVVASNRPRRLSFRRRLICAAALTLMAAPVTAFTAARLLIVESPLLQADVIVLLSGSSSYKERALRTAQLYQQGRGQRVVLTNDGYRGSWSNAEQQNPYYYESTRAELVRLGVPREKVEVLPEIVSSTHEEALLLRNYVDRQRINSILVVTSAYHSRRSLWTFQRVFAGTGTVIGLETASTGWQTPSSWKWWLSLRGWQIVPAEYLKLVYYRLRY